MTTPVSSNSSKFPQCHGSVQFMEQYQGKYSPQTRQRSFEGTCEEIVQKIITETNFGGDPHVKITGGKIGIEFVPTKREIYTISPSILADIKPEKKEVSILETLVPREPILRDRILESAKCLTGSWDLTSLKSIREAFQAAVNYTAANKLSRITIALSVRGFNISGLRIRREDDEHTKI